MNIPKSIVAFLASLIATAKAEAQKLAGAHAEILEQRNKIAAQISEARKTLDQLATQLSEVESSPAYAEAHRVAGGAFARVNSLMETARFAPLYDALAPFMQAYNAIPVPVATIDGKEHSDYTARSGFVKTLTVIPAVNEALISAVGRSTRNPLKPAKLTNKAWSEVETGFNRIRETLKQSETK